MSNWAYCRHVENGETCGAGSGPTLSFTEKLQKRWVCPYGHRNDIGYHGETATEALIDLEERVAAIEKLLGIQPS